VTETQHGRETDHLTQYRSGARSESLEESRHLSSYDWGTWCFAMNKRSEKRNVSVKGVLKSSPEQSGRIELLNITYKTENAYQDKCHWNEERRFAKPSEPRVGAKVSQLCDGQGLAVGCRSRQTGAKMTRMRLNWKRRGAHSYSTSVSTGSSQPENRGRRKRSDAMDEAGQPAFAKIEENWRR
jgi:hypothetical protein